LSDFSNNRVLFLLLYHTTQFSLLLAKNFFCRIAERENWEARVPPQPLIAAKPL